MDENIPDDIVPVSFNGVVYMPHPAEDKVNSCTNCAFHNVETQRAEPQCYKVNCISDERGLKSILFIFKADKPS